MDTKNIKKEITILRTWDYMSETELEEARSFYREACEDVSDDDILYSVIEQCNEDYYDIKREFDEVFLKGNIVVIADVGTWQGRRSGYKVIDGRGRLSDIFLALRGGYDSYRFYIDEEDNVCASLNHHDGSNYVVFYEATDEALEEWEDSEEQDIEVFAKEHFCKLGGVIKDLWGI